MIITTAITPGPPYEDELPFWEGKLAALGYRYIIGSLENSGHWMSNCLRKPSYILERYNEFPDEGILWLDVDTRVMQRMDLIHEKAKEYDFLCHELRSNKLHRRGYWLNAGVLYFAATVKGRELLETWESLCREVDPNSNMPEQRALAQAYYKVNPRFYSLPQSYNCDWDLEAAGVAVIVQEKVSRKYKDIINSGKGISGIKRPITVKEAIETRNKTI